MFVCVRVAVLGLGHVNKMPSRSPKAFKLGLEISNSVCKCNRIDSQNYKWSILHTSLHCTQNCHNSVRRLFATIVSHDTIIVSHETTLVSEDLWDTRPREYVDILPTNAWSTPSSVNAELKIKSASMDALETVKQPTLPS